MAAAADTYFGNRAKVAVGVAGFTPAAADIFLVARGYEVNVQWETAELFGTESIFRADAAKYAVKVEVKLKGCKFGGASNIWQMILNSLNGGTGGTGAIADTNAIYLMDIYVYAVGSADPTNDKISIEIDDCYMEGVPIPFPENDFITLDLTFKGRTVVFGNSAVPT